MAAEAQALNEIAAAMRAGDFPRAAGLAEGLLGRGLNHPLPYQARALHLDQQGRAQEALADFRKARELAPADAMVANGLAICLGRLGQMEEAMAVFDAALALDPALVTTHFHRGWILEMHKDLAGARQAYRSAVTLAPGYAAAWAGLACVEQASSDWPQTRRAALESLSIEPRQPRIVLALAHAEIQESRFADAERHLRAMLAMPGLPPDSKSAMLGLLGDALDRQDKTNEAFAAYAAGNQERRALYLASNPAFDMPALLHRVTAHFARSYPALWHLEDAAPPGDGEAREHIFLLGFPRSGTTLLEQVLGAHPDVETLEETEILDSVAEEFLRSEAGLERLVRLDGAALAHERATYWQRVRAHGLQVEGKTVIDKLPLNTIKLPLIAKFFPRAKILFALRDPRDVVFSCFRRHFQINASTAPFLSLESAVRYYDDVMRLGEMARARLPLSFYLYRHEDLVGDFEGQVRRLCDFAGLQWTERFHDFASLAQQRDIRSISADQVRRGLYSDGADQWRRYATQLQPILPLLRVWAEKFGYASD